MTFSQCPQCTKEKKRCWMRGFSSFFLPHQDRVRRTITDSSIVLNMQESTQSKLNSWNPNPFVDTCCFITAINTIRSGLHIGPQAPQVWQSCQLVGHEIHPSFSVGNHTCALFGPKRFVVPFKKKKRTAMSLHLKR